MSSSSSTTDISLGSPDTSNLWFSEMYNYNYFMKKKWNILLEAGRDTTVTMQHKLHRKKEKKKDLYYTSLKLWIIAKTIHWYYWLHICQRWSLWRTPVLGRTQKQCSALLTPTYCYVSGLNFSLVQARGAQMQKACVLPAHLTEPQTRFKGCVFQKTKHTVMCLDISQACSQALANKIQVC